MNSRWTWAHSTNTRDWSIDDRAYWVAMWEVQYNIDSMDEFPPYVILMRPDKPGLYVSPNLYDAGPEDDIGPYLTWNDVVVAAEMLCCTAGWDLQTEGEAA